MKRFLVPLVALLLGGGFISPVEAKPASEQAPEPVQAPAPVPVVAVAPTTAPPSTQASGLGGEISLAEAQAQAPSTPPFQPNSSLFGGDVGEVDYQGVPSQTNLKARVTLAPQGQPFLVQVTGEQTTGNCPAGPGGSCEYDLRRLDVYGAYSFWTKSTEGNVGPFVRFRDNRARGTRRSPDGQSRKKWKFSSDTSAGGIRGRLRHRLNPKSAANPWIGAGGEYDFANGGFDLFVEGGIRPGNPKNPWNFYAEAGVDSFAGGYSYPEITTPNLVGEGNSKLQVQLQAKGVFYALGLDNSSSRVELGAPITLNISRNTAIQVVPSYVMVLDSNTKSGFGGAIRIRFGF